MADLCICKKRSNIKCILNLCKKCCFAKTCSVHVNNKKITKYNFICSICLLPHDKKLLNSFYNNEINETIYYCCQCYSLNNIIFDNVIDKTSGSHIFNFDVPKRHLYRTYDIQIYSNHLFCPCGCGYFSSDEELFGSDDDDDNDDDDDDDVDDEDKYEEELIFNRTDSPVELASDKINECNICYINKKNYACIPCGHLCLCKVCASKITEKCPICNVKITHITKIFS